MNIDELKESRFLKGTDFKKPALVTIKHAEFQSMNKDGTGDKKRVLLFDELEKPMVMNVTNREACARITGSRDDDHWRGHKVVLYYDPNVQFEGKMIGALRIREPKLKMESPPPPVRTSDRSDDPKPIGKLMPSFEPEGDEPF